jgi:hypothetical protein
MEAKVAQVLKGLTDKELHVFDMFEDEEYELSIPTNY